MLDDEECYLAAIFDDPSGIELAEFSWVDEENDDRCYRVWDYQWCLRGDTVLYTDQGRRQIKDVVGSVRLLTGGDGERGEWVDAEVRYFGQAELWKIDLARRGVTRSLYATADHRWYAGPGRADRRSYTERTTRQLEPGDYLQPMTSPHAEFKLARYSVQAGIVHGDGTKLREGSVVRLYGEKQQLAAWFDQEAKPYHGHEANVEAVQINGLPGYYKTELPVVGEASDAELWGWLAGYFATDGSVLPDGTCQLTSTSARSIFHVRDVATALGVVCSAVGHRERDLPGTDAIAAHHMTEMRVVLRISDLPEEFFLRLSHRLRKALRGDRPRAIDAWQVTAVRPTGVVEDVYCAEVPNTHSFVLDGDILTGNSWYHDESTYQIDQAGRSLGKSVGIHMRAYAFPFNFPGRDMLITAPELNHLNPIADRIESLFLNTRMGKEMLPRVKGGGMKRQPQFQATFINNSHIVCRLPNRDGRGVKGQHPLVLEADEMQDYPAQGWIELIETMKAGSEGAQWRCHGVSRGVRDTYYRMTMGENPDLPFKVHRYMAPHRPTWSDAERRAKIATYGGTEDNVDYRRNIFGEHGDAHNPLFVLARLMACVRINENAWATQYNEDVYAQIKINDELHRKSRLPIESFLDFPASHMEDQYVSYWGGADIGYTNDPTEILIWGLIKRRGQPDLLRQLSRIQLQRISATDQAAVIRQVFRHYGLRLKRFALDKTGNGLPLWQILHEDKQIGSRIAGYGFSEKKAVEFDDREPVGKETAKDLVIEKNVIDFATDELRRLVDTGSLELPYDVEQLTEFQGQSVAVVKDMGSTGDIRKRYSGGSCHTLDAARMLVAGKTLETIERVLATPTRTGPVLERFIY